MEKIILFYKYVDIESPKATYKWLFKLCQELNLKGRILLAQEGINGTLGGTLAALTKFIEAMNNHPLFGGIDFKDSDGSADHFPRMQITIKKEILNSGLAPEYKAHNGGKHLKPSEVHAMLSEKPADLVVLDARNDFEWKIGKFTDAITPDIPHFRDFPDYVDKNLGTFKDKQVLMYCTGGIRCERASAYLKAQGVAKEVYQIEGGIHRYVEQYPEGFFRGKNYVFDARVTVRINDDVVGRCDICSADYDEITNCINASCNKQFIVCPACVEKLHNTCSSSCKELVDAKKVNVRTKPKKLYPTTTSCSL
jgi:predicted sulfurtransferase